MPQVWWQAIAAYKEDFQGLRLYLKHLDFFLGRLAYVVLVVALIPLVDNGGTETVAMDYVILA